MTPPEFDIGDVPRLTAHFTNAAGVPADPGAVALRILKPDGTLVTPTPLSDVVGTWYHDLSLDQSGWWVYRFIGTGANQASEEARLFVRRPLVPLT
jgi:hypothetical protein